MNSFIKIIERQEALFFKKRTSKLSEKREKQNKIWGIEVEIAVQKKLRKITFRSSLHRSF